MKEIYFLSLHSKSIFIILIKLVTNYSVATALNDQIYMFAKQNHKMFRCADKVDVIITDPSLPCSLLYSKNCFYNQELSSLVLKVFNSYKNMTYLIERVKPYNPVGRY